MNISTFNKYSEEMTNKVTQAIEAIREGGEWNNVCYAKKNGKSYSLFFVYIDGEMTTIGSVLQEHVNQMKEEFFQAVHA